MIAQALKDTLEAIKGAAKTTFENDAISVTVLKSAELRWLNRYEPMFTSAVVEKKLKWDDYRKEVLERAAQVGVIAANLAAVRAVIEAWMNGGIGTLVGQDVHVGPAQRPVITGGMAELASRCIDCRKDADGLDPRWDWCTTRLSPPFPGLIRGADAEAPTVRELIEYLLKSG